MGDVECLAGFGASIAGKIVEHTVDPVGSQLGHLGFLFHNKNNVENLRTQIEKLSHAKKRLQQLVDEARRNCEEIEADVKNWLSQADKISEDADKFLREKGQRNPRWNLVSRFKISVEANKMAREAIKLKDAGKFDKVSFLTSPHCVIETKGYVAFESRKANLEGIMEALRDSSASMIGVYGISGIGKTMLVKEIARQAKEEQVFLEVVLVTVSRTPNCETIQLEVAEQLGLSFRERSMFVRANALQQRLKQEKKILVILDDIWEKLDLDEIGISFGDDQKECKILFASRVRKALCDDMDVEKVFEVGSLSNDESTDLFLKIVGDLAKEADFQSLATQIVEECGGLPNTITKVAKELKNKNLYIWKDVLTQLQRSSRAQV